MFVQQINSHLALDLVLDLVLELLLKRLLLSRRRHQLPRLLGRREGAVELTVGAVLVGCAQLVGVDCGLEAGGVCHVVHSAVTSVLAAQSVEACEE